MANDQARGIEVFCAYAEKDQNLFEELEKHLTPLRRQGRLTTWNRQKISAGKKKQEEIDAHLDTAQIILLLISADFMDSDYYSTIEVARAIQKHNAGAARVIPILLRECDLKDTPLESLQTLPRKGTIYGGNRDGKWKKVVDEIRQAIEELEQSEQKKIVLSQSEQHASQEVGAIMQGSSENGDRHPERQATVFLSYSSKAITEVADLQLHLRLRGLQVWTRSDDEHLPPEGRTLNERIANAITHDADGFVLYVTRQCLDKNEKHIWNIELPVALQRKDQESAFPLRIYLRGVTTARLRRFCLEQGLRDLTDFCKELDVDPADAEAFSSALRDAAQRILREAFIQRQRRRGTGSDDKLWVGVKLFDGEEPAPYLDLKLDWFDLFQGKQASVSPETWYSLLIPALKDVKKTLSACTANRRICFPIQAIIPVGFAIGFIFLEPTGFELITKSQRRFTEGQEQHTKIQEQYWSTKGKIAEPESLELKRDLANGDPSVAVVEIAINILGSDDVTKCLDSQNITYGQRWRYELLSHNVRNDEHARYIMQKIREDLRVLCSRRIKGEEVRHIHLFASMPIGLAVLIGHHFNTLCPISVYEYKWNNQVNRRIYEYACTLDARL